jgi:hypothetical protein
VQCINRLKELDLPSDSVEVGDVVYAGTFDSKRNDFDDEAATFLQFLNFIRVLGLQFVDVGV